MRRVLLFALAAACAAIAACRSSATDDIDFIAFENQWVEALQTHDTATLDRLLDPTFVDLTFRGTLRTKHDVLTGPPAGGAYHSTRFEDLVIRRYGKDTAIATGINVVQGASPGDIARVRFTDVFVRRDGVWRAVSAQETLKASR